MMHTHGNTEMLMRALTAPRRNHFFYGKRMDVQHFEMEQQYGKLKQWLLNRLTIGKGVLCGLRVSVDGQRVCVDPGVAIDGLGREIIVPVRTCIDPLTVDDGCCGHHHQGGSITPSKPAGNPNTHNHPGELTSTGHHGSATTGDGPPASPKDGVFTLWVCYRECLADYEPVLVSDCKTRDHCAAGSIVESFCLKSTPGLPPLQGDPDWCAKLWKQESMQPTPANSGSIDEMMTHVSGPGSSNANTLGFSQADRVAIQEALKSRRHSLCNFFDETCEPPEGDPCVPLAIVVIRNGELSLGNCLARPRIYSNARLLDLILCLSDKIDECCNKHDVVDLMRVRSVEFLARGEAGEVFVAGVQSPTIDTQVNIERHPNAIRIRFSKPFATNQHRPTTHGLKGPDHKIHNVQVLPEKPLGNFPYVPGTLTVETADTFRFDLLPGSPYYLKGKDGGWQKGRYRIFLRGTEDLPNGRQALADTGDHAFDGEPIAPAGGVMSGNGTEGGDFDAYFVVGVGEQTKTTMRVRSVEFLGPNNQVIAHIASAIESNISMLAVDLKAIRIQFTKALATDKHKPTTPGPKDLKHQNRNVQVLKINEKGTVEEFVPGSIRIDAPDMFTFVLAKDVQGGRYRLFLQGNDDLNQDRPALADIEGVLFDGEPIAPINNVLSGNSVPGGDFTTTFTLDEIG